MESKKETATFGGGCFWCTEAIFKNLKGVHTVMPGYAGGTTEKPTYAQVCNGNTGHAEVIQIAFDPDMIPYTVLLQVFFGTHDPTTLNRQGNDVGEQYRSVIFYHDDNQKTAAEKMLLKLHNEGVFEKPIVTEIKPFTNFFDAENYHRDYFARNPDNPYCQAVISPKMAKFREKFQNYIT